MPGRVEVTRVGPVMVVDPTTDRFVDIVVLNLGPNPVEIIEGPHALGSGFLLVAGGEFEARCSGSATFWAVTSSTVPVTLAVSRTVIEKSPITWEFKGPVEDAMFARLPYPEAQEKLRGPALPAGARLLTCEWHGEGADGDPEHTSFAIVNEEDEALAELLGERIQLTFQNHVAFAYVHRAMPLDSQLSVTRRLYMALAPLSITEIVAQIKVVV